MVLSSAPLCAFIIFVIISKVLNVYEVVPLMSTNDDEYDGCFTPKEKIMFGYGSAWPVWTITAPFCVLTVSA